MLTSASAFSQISFPALIQFNGDTVVAITVPQMDTISARLMDCKRLLLADSLIDAKSNENKACSILVELQGQQVKELKNEITDLKDLSIIQGRIIKNEKEINVENEKKRKKKNRNNLLIGVPVSLAFGVLIGVTPSIVRQF